MNVSEVIAAFLKRAGVDCIFGYPGDPSVEFLEGARKQGTEFVLATREGTAGLMAEAYGMITGKPGVALSTLGPGSTNLVNAVANAFLEEYDLLLTPMMPIAAFEAGHEVPPGSGMPRWPLWSPFSYPFNLTQQPAATIPCGLTGTGLPVGLQIVGPLFGERLVLRASAAYERACPPPRCPI